MQHRLRGGQIHGPTQAPAPPGARLTALEAHNTNGMVALIANGLGPRMPSLRAMLTDQPLLYVHTSLWSLGGSNPEGSSGFCWEIESHDPDCVSYDTHYVTRRDSHATHSFGDDHDICGHARRMRQFRNPSPNARGAGRNPRDVGQNRCGLRELSEADGGGDGRA